VLATIRAVCSVKPVDIETHELALDLVKRYRFSVYDGLILAAAALAGCTVLYTEDLRHRQRVDGVTISNPFAGYCTAPTAAPRHGASIRLAHKTFLGRWLVG